MAQPTLRDFLHLGANQTYSCHALFHRLQSTHSTLRALGIPRDGHVRPQSIAPDNVVTLHIDQPTNLEQDSYFPHVLNRLKDERVLITKILMGQTNWYSFRPPSSLDLSGFIHITHLVIHSSIFSENHLCSLLSSLLSLRTVELHNNLMQDYRNNQVASTLVERPNIRALALTMGNDTCWTLLDLFTSDRSPVEPHTFERLELRRPRSLASGDGSLSRRMSALLKLMQFPFALDMDDFNITLPMSPMLNLENIKELTITLCALNNYYDFSYQTLVWWTETLRNIPGWTKLCTITIKVELGPPAAVNAPHPHDLAQWAAFDEALCRIEISSGLEHLRYKVVPRSGYAGHPSYDCDTMRRWLCLRCLPRARIFYTASEDCDFRVLDWANREVDMSGIM
ncbi:uncharacterized protein BT62DRAFT_925575 [Guyanagaster necrorhizus]|uniref:Uncharacterized protein n=1 Tax=Guyanagaster necrorhizus TaxID=856835 RepID=A0A9P8AYV2_9AGAR|nr:uncharacterized protein BT62DRAFT_925575 [Guyanagaster necrorhizus MCA 3950]KAG7453033.1 hypothetical protein BT62DRAFT_925575 [Guyanagaster necrorhizus MCA 3950]